MKAFVYAKKILAAFIPAFKKLHVFRMCVCDVCFEALRSECYQVNASFANDGGSSFSFVLTVLTSFVLSYSG